MKKPGPAARNAVLASMEGRCPACGETIDVGTQIALTDDGRWVHAAPEDQCLDEWEGE
jgi:hypothetical protein